MLRTAAASAFLIRQFEDRYVKSGATGAYPGTTAERVGPAAVWIILPGKLRPSGSPTFHRHSIGFAPVKTQ